MPNITKKHGRNLNPKKIESNSGGGFALDHHQHLFCNNSVILISPDENIINPYFLLAVLNSKVFWTWTQQRMPTLGSGWHCYRVSILRKFPLPISQIKQNIELSSKIIHLAQTLLHEQISEDDRVSIISSVDHMVSKLYNISLSENPKSSCFTGRQSNNS